MRVNTERKMRRWREQRWLLDQVIKANGLDWDQARTARILRNCGSSVLNEIRDIGRKVEKFSDIPREFSRAAERREELALEAEKQGHDVEAREHYYVSANFYTNAQLAIYEEGNPRRIALGKKKKASYDRFIEFAEHRIERLELPFEDKSLPALLHFPTRMKLKEKVPCVLFIPGMDGGKEDTPLSRDPFLERGIALLSIDGPGQGEARERGIKVTASNYELAGKAACDYLTGRPEIDESRLAIIGTSMGSYWGTRVAAAESRFKACALTGVCVEPGQYTIFNTASPTFKLNYMYMAGYDDEDAFDEFARTLTLKGVASKVSCPYFIVAGEDDELCPIEFIYELMDEIPGPKVLVIFEGEKHSISNPRARALAADWLTDRLDGKPFKSEKIYVELGGKEVRTEEF